MLAHRGGESDRGPHEVGEQATGDLVFSYVWSVVSADARVVSAGTDEGDVLD